MSFWSSDAVHDTMHQITPRLYQSSLEAATQIDQLTERGITHIISVLLAKELPRGHRVLTAWKAAGIIQHTFLLDDTDDSRFLRAMDDVVSYVCIDLPKESIVLVHCKAGTSRSTATVMAILIWEDRTLTVESALQQVRAIRTCVYPNYWFMRGLQVFHDKWTAWRRENDERQAQVLRGPDGIPFMFPQEVYREDGSCLQRWYDHRKKLPFIDEIKQRGRAGAGGGGSAPHPARPLLS